MQINEPRCLVCKSVRLSTEWTIEPTQILEQLNLEWGLINLMGESIQLLKKTPRLSHLVCLDCNLGFWFPTISGDANFYESISSTYIDYRWDKQIVRKHIQRSKSVLDVGSGPNPIFLKFSRNSKKRFTSLDINPVVNGDESDDFVRISGLDQLVCEDRSYQEIVALHFLEHIANPIEYFKTLISRLDSRGSLWISVPNRDRLERTKPFESLDVPPHHVTSWNLASLQNFAKIHGFVVVNAWVSKQPSDSRIVRGFGKYVFNDFSRIIFKRIPLAKRNKLKGFQLLVQLKHRRFNA